MSARADRERAAAPMVVAEEPVSGPAAALILAGGIAALCMGVVTTLSEASTDVADALQWNDRVGPLSGKTIVTVIVFVVSWALLTLLWRRTNVAIRSVTFVSVALIALGLIGTFPTFFQAFE